MLVFYFSKISWQCQGLIRPASIFGFGSQTQFLASGRGDSDVFDEKRFHFRRDFAHCRLGDLDAFHCDRAARQSPRLLNVDPNPVRAWQRPVRLVELESPVSERSPRRRSMNAFDRLKRDCSGPAADSGYRSIHRLPSGFRAAARQQDQRGQKSGQGGGETRSTEHDNQHGRRTSPAESGRHSTSSIRQRQSERPEIVF